MYNMIENFYPNFKTLEKKQKLNLTINGINVANRVSGNNFVFTLNFGELICAVDIYQYEHTEILSPKA